MAAGGSTSGGGEPVVQQMALLAALSELGALAGLNLQVGVARTSPTGNGR